MFYLAQKLQFLFKTLHFIFKQKKLSFVSKKNNNDFNLTQLFNLLHI